MARLCRGKRPSASVQLTTHPLLMRRYNVITDKGTYDAIGLSEGGPAQQLQYIKLVHGRLQPGGLLTITSCNSTLQELIQAFTSNECFSGDTQKQLNGSRDAPAEERCADTRAHGSPTASNYPGPAPCTLGSTDGHLASGKSPKAEASGAQPGISSAAGCPARWVYVDHVRTYKVYSFGGFEGSRVCTVAFKAA